MNKAPTDDLEARLDPHARCLQACAARAGVPTRAVLLPVNDQRPLVRLELRFGPSVFYYRTGVLRQARPDGSVGWNINRPAVRHTMSKSRAKALLAANGFPVPIGRSFNAADAAAAAAFAARIGGAVCVKPDGGMKGRCVFPGVQGEAAVLRAFGEAAASYSPIIVERSVPGEIVRFFYVQPHVVGVKLSVPANVVGDGVSTIAALVEAKNRLRQERNLPGHYPIDIDAGVTAFLAEQGLSLASVPEQGRRVLLRLTSNASTGGDTIECADSVHPSYAREVEEACRAFPGLAIAAIDMAVCDRREQATAENHWFLEINSAPDLLTYHYPWEGRPQDVGGAIIAYLRRRSEAAAKVDGGTVDGGAAMGLDAAGNGGRATA